MCHTVIWGGSSVATTDQGLLSPTQLQDPSIQERLVGLLCMGSMGPPGWWAWLSLEIVVCPCLVLLSSLIVLRRHLTPALLMNGLKVASLLSPPFLYTINS